MTQREPTPAEVEKLISEVEAYTEFWAVAHPEPLPQSDVAACRQEFMADDGWVYDAGLQTFLREAR